MANSFSNLVANAYKELDVISRELVGVVNSVTLDADASAVPVGQTLYSFVAPASTASTITPAVTPPDDGDQTIGSKTLTITSQRRVPFRWGGEEAAALNRGAGASKVQAMQLKQAIRTIVNEMEADVLATVRKGASRAYGTAATTPFASDLAGAANIRKIMDDNGADGGRSLIIDTSAGVNLRLLTQLTKANEAGSSMQLRDGEILDLFGYSIKESGAVGIVTKGTGTSYQSNSATLPIGSTSIPLDTGSGTVLAGDVVTFAGDTNKYVVATGVAAAGTIVINAPGLKVALADNTAMTIGGNFTSNVAFSQSAVVLATRTPYVGEGELAINEEIVQDPYSGIAFRLAQYANYYRTQYEISAVWGSTVFKSEHAAILLG